MTVRNTDMRKIDYEETQYLPRPGHADYTYQMKYGIRASSGGGRSSARETIGRVCAGAIALKYLKESSNTKIVAFVDSVMDIRIPDEALVNLIQNPPTPTEVDNMSRVSMSTDGRYIPVQDGSAMDDSVIITRCPHGPTAAAISTRISQLRADKDSCGGTVMGVISNVPIGLGEPVFDKFHAELAKAIMSIPAVKGFEIGSGFEGARTMMGSQHNDCFSSDTLGQLRTRTNHSGGILGGITSGENVYFRVAFKPVSSIGKPQETCTFSGEQTVLELHGRHDPCILPRAPPIVEAMMAITVMDFVLRQKH
jgi:chorismate synthase